MLNRLFGSLVFKISAVIIIVETLALAAIGYYYVERFSFQIDERVRTQLSIPGRLMNSQALDYASVSDKQALEELVGEQLAAAIVIGRNGQVFWSSDPDMVSQPAMNVLRSAAVHHLDPSVRDIQIEKTEEDGRTYLLVTTPLLRDDALIGYLHLEADTSRSEDLKRSIAVLFAVGSVLCILLTSVTEVLLVHHVIIPRIRQTTGCLAQAEAGDLTARMEGPFSDDEIGSLQRSVNAMLGETERRTRERAAAERALRESEEQLRQSQKMEAVGRLAGGVAHDFNNLLTVITGHSELLAAEFPEKSDARISAEEIRKGAERAAVLTRRLLTFGRRQVLNTEFIDLNEVILNLENMLERLIGEDVEFRVQLDRTIGTLEADRSQIEQIIMNLVVNARDAMPGGGLLEIVTAGIGREQVGMIGAGLGDAERYVRLTVSDTGHGMDRETQARIFEPFFTTKEVERGTGLGLSTVYGIVTASNGRIDVTSAPDEGARFDILLPAFTRAPEAAVVTPGRESGERGRGQETILVVEDEDVVRDLIIATLERNGYRVLAAANGDDALDTLRRQDGRIDLLLTDVVMPGMSGVKLANEAIGHWPEVRILFMSGYMGQSDAAEAALTPGTAFIQKPFRPRDLEEKIRETMAQ